MQPYSSDLRQRIGALYKQGRGNVMKKSTYLYWLTFRSKAESLEMLTEREGFEPSVLWGHPISSRAHSTTLPPLLS